MKYLNRQFPAGIIKGLLNDDYDDDVFEVVSEGKWISDGKYDYRSVIFRDIREETCYEISESRSGSYFTDYYYSFDDTPEDELIDCLIMKLTEIVKTEWRAVEAPNDI